MTTATRIVFVDGYCTLCNKWVQFVLQRDKSREIHFAPIQGKTAVQLLSLEERTSVNYIQYHRDNKLYTRSSAAIRILRDLKGLWKMSALLLLVPKFIRDALYNFVAKRRYTWFPRKETCTLLPGFTSQNILQ